MNMAAVMDEPITPAFALPQVNASAPNAPVPPQSRLRSRIADAIFTMRAISSTFSPPAEADKKSLLSVTTELRSSLNSPADIQQFLTDFNRTFKVSFLREDLRTAACHSSLGKQASKYGKNLYDLVKQRCSNMGFITTDLIYSMPWTNSAYDPALPASAANDPGYENVLLSYVIGLNVKEAALSRLMGNRAAPLTPGTDILLWLPARVQDFYTAGMLGPHSDTDIPLRLLRERLQDSKHELASLAMEHLSLFLSTTPGATLDGFIYHFQNACATQLAAWSAPKPSPPIRFNLVDDMDEVDSLEGLFAISGRCAYCGKPAHFWKECRKLEADTKRGKVQPGWTSKPGRSPSGSKA